MVKYVNPYSNFHMAGIPTPRTHAQIRKRLARQVPGYFLGVVPLRLEKIGRAKHAIKLSSGLPRGFIPGLEQAFRGYFRQLPIANWSTNGGDPKELPTEIPALLEQYLGASKAKAEALADFDGKAVALAKLIGRRQVVHLIAAKALADAPAASFPGSFATKPGERIAAAQMRIRAGRERLLEKIVADIYAADPSLSEPCRELLKSFEAFDRRHSQAHSAYDHVTNVLGRQFGIDPRPLVHVTDANHIIEGMPPREAYAGMRRRLFPRE